MAVSIQKTYSVVVTYSYDDGSAITDEDLNVAVLREKIKERIEHASRISKGIINAQPAAVSEA